MIAALMLLLLAQQPPAVVQIQVRAGGHPVAGAEVSIEGRRHTTDAAGKLSITLEPGEIEITVTREGFVPSVTRTTVAAGQEQTAIIELARHTEEITVFATRTEARIDDQPIRVEVLDRDEIEEKMLMTPGDIVMMLNEMGGMRVQATSPSLGAASVRIQGMRGRYTRFLSDGLPLFGQQVGGLGLLQIPPMDLGQVEVIKGVASSLYGAGAMGGVVNLVSRRPGTEPVREALLNQSTRGATDAVFFLSSPLRNSWSISLLGGGHFQRRTDVDDDGWADLAGYRRAVLRPRFFWDDNRGRTLFLTTGITLETRKGGTTGGARLPATGEAYEEALDTAHVDVGAVGQFTVGEKYLVSARFAAARRTHDHRFGEVRERDTHTTLFAEVTGRRTFSRHTLVAGVAIENDSYAPRDVPRFRYTHTIPGVFLQDDIAAAPWLAISASARLDHHSTYGSFFSPRLSALFRRGPWSSRVSAGQGFFGPTPLTEETEAAGLSRLTIPAPLRPERGRSASLDLTRTVGSASFTATLFGSRISNPVDVERATVYELKNLAEATTNTGYELLAVWRPEPFSLTASYTFVRSRELEQGRRIATALTPRHSAGIVGMWEAEGKARIGVELYYTGRQSLEDNPYRPESPAYVIFGLLAERRFGPLRAFINAENLGGVRQTRWNPLLRPSRAPDGRWTVDAWAPLEGRVFNGGIRVEF